MLCTLEYHLQWCMCLFFYAECYCYYCFFLLMRRRLQGGNRACLCTACRQYQGLVGPRTCPRWRNDVDLEGAVHRLGSQCNLDTPTCGLSRPASSACWEDSGQGRLGALVAWGRMFRGRTARRSGWGLSHPLRNLAASIWHNLGVTSNRLVLGR